MESTWRLDLEERMENAAFNIFQRSFPQNFRVAGSQISPSDILGKEIGLGKEHFDVLAIYHFTYLLSVLWAWFKYRKEEGFNEIGASSRARYIEQNDYLHKPFVKTPQSSILLNYYKNCTLSINRLELLTSTIFISTLVMGSGMMLDFGWDDSHFVHYLEKGEIFNRDVP